MITYEVKFQNGKRIRRITVTATGIVPAIEKAIVKHFDTCKHPYDYEVVSATKVDAE